MVPGDAKSFFLSVSLLIKSFLLFILPVIVFSFVFYSFSRLGGHIFGFTSLLLVLVCLSNFTAVMFSYGVGMGIQDWISTGNGTSPQNIQELKPLFDLTFPKICDPTVGLVGGFVLGVYANLRRGVLLKKLAKDLSQVMNWFLQHFFIPILPLFILGFMLKMQHEKTLYTVLGSFAPLLVSIVTVHIFYLVSGYWVFHGCHLKKTIAGIKNIMPAALIGFSTMSSAAAMPVLTTGAAKNTRDPKLAQSIVPSVVNSHMLGDALAIPLMAFFLCLLHFQGMPAWGVYLKFALGYTLAKFAASGVPGGTILVIIPVLESYLGFTPEMSGIILMMYMLFDPFCTLGNVLGNGLLPMVFEKAWNRLRRSPPAHGGPEETPPEVH